MTEKDLFIRSAQIDWSKIPKNSNLRKIPALQDLSEILAFMTHRKQMLRELLSEPDPDPDFAEKTDSI